MRHDKQNNVFYVFLLLVSVASIGIYLFVFVAHVPGFREERFGVLPELPKDLGTWKRLEEGPESEAARAEGLVREERLLMGKNSLLGDATLTKQVRFRSAETNEIVRVLPDERIVRRRTRVKKA